MSVTEAIGLPTAQAQSFSAARTMAGIQRRQLALDALAGVRSVTQLAHDNEVSRKFVYQQAAKGAAALDQCFAQSSAEQEVLFTLPVTRQWLEAFMLELMLNGHSPMRGVQQIIEDLFPATVSLGTIHNVVYAAAKRAQVLHAEEDLSAIRVGAHDEIFQAGQPVLVGADADSTYCYLLALAQGRGETEWGAQLLDLGAKGLHPDYTVADFGRGLRAGQAAAWPGIPCHGDVFHVERAVSQVVVYLEHRALRSMAAVETLSAQMQRAKKHHQGRRLSAALAAAREEEGAALDVADDVACLARWLAQDVLAIAGPDLPTRRELFDWIVRELRLREAHAPHRLGPLCRLLENNRDDILGFVSVLEQALAALAQEFHVAAGTVQALGQWQGLPADDPRRWQQEAALRRQLGARFYPLQHAVQQALAQVVRASSIIENLNSRLRSYFFLRRELGPEYLDLLRFFLNHRRFQRSQRAERVGRSPIELLTGQTQPHWLTLLGYPLPAQAA